MATGEPRDDRQAEAGAAVTVALGIQAGERSGEALELGGRDARTVVAHAELDAPSDPAGRDVDADRAGGGGTVAPRVLDEVRQDALERGRSAAPGQARRQGPADREPRAVRSVAESFEDGIDHDRDVDRSDRLVRQAAGAREFDDLPAKARDYVVRLEELAGAPVSCIGVGPGRDQTIVRRDVLSPPA